ncbi:Gfo/Idh/MocA family protein [Thermodesulfobium acidiphilum]|uniref:Gfo/Idh/MocA family protein n=1 Tax=Thermodesulfobium acidiphilum TaxID=1794699 RepID=UPI002278FF7C|nr:Gfo/Idh/MocA family oxidoreductase [Thermodesulfobium acidiphilum]
MKTSVNVAVIGAGDWGVNLIRNFFELGYLRSVCDLDSEKLIKVESQYKSVNCVTNPDEIFSSKDIDAVVISTPSSFHYSLAKKALNSGKHVFVEKPMALNVKEGEELVELARSKDLRLLVGHVLLYHPAVQTLHQLVMEGELGDIHYIHSSRLNLGKVSFDESVLWNLAPHDLSIFFYLLGLEGDIVVSSTGHSFLSEDRVDIAHVTLEFKDIFGNIFVSWLHPRKIQQTVVIGTKKMAIFDDRAPHKLILYNKGAKIVNGKPFLNSGGEKIVDFEQSEPLKNECRSFIESIIYKKDPITEGMQGLRILEILEAAEESILKKGAPVKLSYKSKKGVLI